MREPDKIASFIQEHYDIGRVNGLSCLDGGYSEVLRVDCTGGSYVFKEIEANGMNHPETEVEVNRFLKSQGFPVASFIPTRLGNAICCHNEKACHLQTLERGATPARNTTSPSLLEQSATLLGQLHAALAVHPPLPAGMEQDWFDGINVKSAEEFHRSSLLWAEATGNEEISELLHWKIAHVNELSRFGLDFKKLTRGNTHGDYHIGQLLVENDNISALIDISGCVHPLCWEVLRSYCYLDPACSQGSIHTGNLLQYVSEYQKHFHLSRYDLEAMPTFLCMQLLACNYFHQVEYAPPGKFEHIVGITLWASRLCKWLSENRLELGRTLAALG